MQAPIPAVPLVSGGGGNDPMQTLAEKVGWHYNKSGALSDSSNNRAQSIVILVARYRQKFGVFMLRFCCGRLGAELSDPGALLANLRLTAPRTVAPIGAS